jgi:hypothetical protein
MFWQYDHRGSFEKSTYVYKYWTKILSVIHKWSNSVMHLPDFVDLTLFKRIFYKSKWIKKNINQRQMHINCKLWSILIVKQSNYKYAFDYVGSVFQSLSLFFLKHFSLLFFFSLIRCLSYNMKRVNWVWTSIISCYLILWLYHFIISNFFIFVYIWGTE